ncbi:MAG TPA: mandelate racemase/muconate lactonizing enzyme family protein [Candidatus Limnocylindrales bacterium]|nr:mandelate racemase/muconate lactonizing enzyme family protein [Candidatus Limnocylindrales bacterium]
MTGAPGLRPAVSGFDRAALRIERIETLALRAPLARRFSGSAYAMDNRCTIITRLHTADGLVSEVYNGDTDAEQAVILRIIHEELAPALIGRSAADPEGAWLAMEPATNDILRDRGLALQAIACLDTAIWDVFGKALGQPIRRVWGALTDELPISVIGGYYHLDLDGLARLIEGYVEAGFAGCKLKVGGRTPAEDAQRVRVARQAAGPSFALMADANQGYERAQAVEFGRRVADQDLRWFEEPCRWLNDRRWMRDVRLQTGIPVAAGQSEVTLGGLRDLVVEGAIDVSNFDASWSGGPTIWRKAAGVCAAFGVELGHHEEPQVAGQLLASVPRSTFVECFDRERDPFFWQLSDLSAGLGGGRLRLPDRPGFGLELDAAFVERHTVARRVTA